MSGLVIVATRTGSATLVYLLLAFVVCAAAVIVGLEAPLTAAERTEPPSGSAIGVGGPPSGAWIGRASAAALVVLGLGAGLSPFFSGYYGTGVWVPIGLAVVVAAAAAAVARQQRLTLPAMVALAGVGGLGLWSLLSSSWAQSVEPAIVDANRWLSYTAFLLLLMVLIRGRRHGAVLLAAVGVGIAVVALSVLVRMLGSDPATLFVSGRINSPLGYINGEGCVFAMGCWLALALAERREGLLAGVGAGVAVAMASLTLLSQSRGGGGSELGGRHRRADRDPRRATPVTRSGSDRGRRGGCGRAGAPRLFGGPAGCRALVGGS